MEERRPGDRDQDEVLRSPKSRARSVVDVDRRDGRRAALFKIVLNGVP